MSRVDDPELFFCVICEKYRSIGMLKELAVKDSWHKKNVCTDCLKKITDGETANGNSGTSEVVNK